jgi:2-polyprenyl-6-methoxyphenol hydroxylase-like FAD-dependent oxidoreductase
VAIVGGGVAGSAAAAVLARNKLKVVIIDRHSTYPADFRAEKLGGDQIDLLRRLGLLDCVARRATRFDEILNIRNGRLVDRTRRTHYALPYHHLVAAVRGAIPPSVEFLVGRVERVETSPDWQRIVVAGRAICARIIVLATGLGAGLSRDIGLHRNIISDGHSMTIGFDIEPCGEAGLAVPAITYYGSRAADRIDYLTVFPMSGGLRANLFAFHGYREPWTQTFQNDPHAALLSAMPGLKRFLGEFRITGRVQVRVNDLYEIVNCRRAGVAAIGDAFQTSCPAAGTGVSRVLHDVERLCAHYIPQWLDSPGMGAAKISEFYDDERKRAFDARSMKVAEYRRAWTTEFTLSWKLHRNGRFLLRRMRQRARDAASWALASCLTPIRADG